MKASPKKPATRDALTQDYLKKLLRYDPETGLFHWLVDRNNRIKAGDLAGSYNGDGYPVIVIHGRIYMSHRLAWLYMTGQWPLDEIDHINRDKKDNRFSNLRESDRYGNILNRGDDAMRSNILGIRGIRQFRDGRWHARISHQNVCYHLGYYETLDEAKAAHYGAKIIINGINQTRIVQLRSNHRSRD